MPKLSPLIEQATSYSTLQILSKKIVPPNDLATFLGRRSIATFQAHSFPGSVGKEVLREILINR